MSWIEDRVAKLETEIVAVRKKLRAAQELETEDSYVDSDDHDEYEETDPEVLQLRGRLRVAQVRQKELEDQLATRPTKMWLARVVQVLELPLHVTAYPEAILGSLKVLQLDRKLCQERMAKEEPTRATLRRIHDEEMKVYETRMKGRYKNDRYCKKLAKRLLDIEKALK